MAISGIADFTGYDPDYVPTEPGGQLGKNDFLKLIIAQLEHQDPLEPVSSTEFMQQLTAMGTLEEMQNLNSNFKEMMTSQGLIFGSQLIGRTVEAIDQTTRSVIEGVVGRVSIENGEVKVQVGDTVVDIKDIISVTPWTSSNALLQASQMIGMEVTAPDPKDLLGFNIIRGIVKEVSIFGGEVKLELTDIVSGYKYSVGLEDILTVTSPEDPAEEGSGEDENSELDDSGEDSSDDSGGDSAQDTGGDDSAGDSTDNTQT